MSQYTNSILLFNIISSRSHRHYTVLNYVHFNFIYYLIIVDVYEKRISYNIMSYIK